jgi:sigma-E factor negative regulatory protein RseC
MIEDIAVVTRAEGGRAWLRRRQNGACGGCVQQASCGTATLGRLLPGRELEVVTSLDLQAGDRVRVTIDDAHLLAGSALLYLLPLLLMFAGIGLAKALLPAEAAEAWLPEIALAGLLLAFRAVHCAQKRLLRFIAKPDVVLLE